MDFFNVTVKNTKNGVEISPSFRVGHSKDLMVRARSFYAIWDEERGLWSTDEYDVARLVDRELYQKADELKDTNPRVLSMKDFSSNSWKNFKEFVTKINDNVVELDGRVIFANDVIKRENYASHVLPYEMKDGDHSAFDTLLSKLYSEDERKKLLWGIGSIVSGDSRHIQKFMVLYGKSGAGKSTVLNIVQGMFDGYCVPFDAGSLGHRANQFSLEPFKSNPLVAIQHDGDLSRIDDNTRLNSIVSHETIPINEKYKPQYYMRPSAFLMVGTNQPVKITDSKSGLIRRLIDVSPTGDTFPPSEYQKLMNAIRFEYGAIAKHCLDVYEELGCHYYDDYIPLQMMFRTDPVFNFVEDISLQVMRDGGISLKSAYAQYKEYCAETNIGRILPLYVFKDDFAEYFDKVETRMTINGERVRNWYTGFRYEKIFADVPEVDKSKYQINLDKTESQFDKLYADCPAQYSSPDGIPAKRWDDVSTKLSDLDTKIEHYVRIPENHIVIDFDLKNSLGEKDKEKNLRAASEWPETYAEFSKSGSGLHLHYIYDGDVSKLSSVYSDGIEIKKWTGKSSLRRRLSFCNDIPIAHISSGLPEKERTPTINKNVFVDEQRLRATIGKALRKEVHPSTKPNVDFIDKLLSDAYNSGKPYDVRDMRMKILKFAMGSTHNADYCVRIVKGMRFCSDTERVDTEDSSETPMVFFDVEIYPNLFLVCHKTMDGDVVSMINPKPEEIEVLLNNRLVGFNNRRYDNHILYGALMGYTNEQLYRLSKKIIDGSREAFFTEAYNISYTDVYDFCSKKQTLKKWEIELGIHHQEMGISWDEPCPEEMWPKVVEYCSNDVKATQAVFENRHEDWEARKMLASLAGASPNTTTNTLTQMLVFGNDRHPPFIWTDLSETFPGYKFEFGKSTYQGEVVGEGGYVYSEPGIYRNVALLDIASMHPHSIKALNIWGDKYTKQYFDLVEARIAIKHGDMDKVRSLMGGKLSPFVSDDPKALKQLSSSLKIPINSIYGLTSAGFGNRCNGGSSSNNKDNIVAKRGALFMINLKHEVQERGFAVAHIKTDSIKIPDATPEIIEFVMDYGAKYGYTFEHEATYDRMCLVNDAVYIAHDGDGWHATGLQFQRPYVYKTLFSHEDLCFSDFCETKSVSKGQIYIRFPDGDHFIGGVGLFIPVIEGGELLRILDGKEYAVTGTKGYKWREAEELADDDGFDRIDMRYFDRLVDEAKDEIEKYGSFDEFVSHIS